MVITTAELHATEPELRFCTGSNPARGVSEIRDGEDLWQWSQLEIRLNTFRRSTITQKQFIIITILKDWVDVCLVHLTNSGNYSLQTSVSPQKLKQAEAIPLYKKLDPLNKANYRQVRPLPHLSKVFERIIYKRVNCYMEDKLTKCLPGFKKLYGTQ